MSKVDLPIHGDLNEGVITSLTSLDQRRSPVLWFNQINEWKEANLQVEI